MDLYKEVKTVEVYARRWFQKTYGNTYHTVTIIVNRSNDTESVIDVPIQYGYGDHYKQTAWQYLHVNGYDVPESYFEFLDFAHNLPIIWNVEDVDRKRDL